VQGITHGAHHGATQKAVWLACGRVANVIGARSLVHRREGKESEVVLKVRVRYCSRQCSRGESTRESDVVIAVGG